MGISPIVFGRPAVGRLADTIARFHRSNGMSRLNSAELPNADSSGASAAQPARNRWWLWALILVVAAIAIWYYRGASSTSQAQDPAAAAGKGKSAAAAGNFVVPVVVATAQRGDLPVYFNGLGTVTAFNTVTVHSRVDGQIVKVNFTEGQYVHEGDPLVEIDPRPFQVQLEQAQGQLAKDQAQRVDAEVNFERFKLLYQEGVIPKQQLDTQGAQVGQFDGAIKSDQAAIDNAKLQIVYAHITSPISGRVGLRLVDIGNIVHASDTNAMLVITQLQPISVIFTLPQDQLPLVMTKLRSGSQLTVEAFDRDDTARIATGKLATIDNQIDVTTGTYKLKSVFNNENNSLFPNQFVNIHLLVDIKHDLIIIPAAAIQRGPQGTYVYVVSNNNTVNIRNVTVAQTTGNTIGLSTGLQPGDVVVIDGQDKLQDSSRVATTTSPTGSNPPASSAAAPPSKQDGPQSGDQAGHKAAGRPR
jgi:membrane fusion protein, multidrug efflux system